MISLFPALLMAVEAIYFDVSIFILLMGSEDFRKMSVGNLRRWLLASMFCKSAS